jgi:hypothetical protein
MYTHVPRVQTSFVCSNVLVSYLNNFEEENILKRTYFVDDFQ